MIPNYTLDGNIIEDPKCMLLDAIFLLLPNNWSIRTPFREQAVKTLFACHLADRPDKAWIQAFYKAVRFLCTYATQCNDFLFVWSESDIMHINNGQTKQRWGCICLPAHKGQVCIVACRKCKIKCGCSFLIQLSDIPDPYPWYLQFEISMYTDVNWFPSFASHNYDLNVTWMVHNNDNMCISETTMLDSLSLKIYWYPVPTS